MPGIVLGEGVVHVNRKCQVSVLGSWNSHGKMDSDHLNKQTTQLQ